MCVNTIDRGKPQMTSTTQAIQEYGHRMFLNVASCPYGNPECESISGLYFGQLSCFRCYRDASTDAQETYAAVV